MLTMNKDWKKPIIIKKDVKLTDIVHGTLSKDKQERMNWHFDHPTPYYSTSMKGDPYGNHKGKRRT